MNTKFITLLTILLSVVSMTNYSIAANLFARVSGNWGTNGTWSTTLGGASCACTPAAGDNVTIPSPFTVTLNANINTAINSITINTGAILDGNGKNLEGIVNAVTNNGTMTDVKNLETGRFFNTGTAAMSGDITLTIQTGVIFNNSGTLTAKDMKEAFARYPVPLGTFVAGTYPEFINSGAMTLEKIQFDGYFTNEATGNMNITKEVHADGLVCNRGIITTDVLKMHGGSSDCAGFWIVEEIDFSENDKQTGVDKPGELFLGDYCTSSGVKPTIKKPNEGSISPAVTFCTALLSVQMIEFLGTDNGNQIILSWTTASEIDNDYFEVYSSSNGIDFNKIGTVKGKKDSQQEQNYRFEHHPENLGLYYYQLKQIDTDGTFTMTEVITVKYLAVKQTDIVQAFPNPTNGIITLTYFNSQVHQDLKGTIYNLQGIAVKEIHLDKNTQQINLTELKKGIYIIRFENGEHIKICKL